MAKLHFSPATVEVQGQRIEAYSVIPWQTDPQTSFRALTQPADPQPSAHLAALLTAAKFQAEELGTGLLKKVITPAGEVATEILGVSAAALARAASLTAGLLLLATNGKDDAGYKSEWAFNKINSPLTDKDRTRLAHLEQEQEHRALTTDEQAELFVLLARVNGIHAQPATEVEELEIIIPPEHKIDRTLLNPPKKPGNAPKFKSDGTSVEIHHEGQQRGGPFREMHWEEHRGRGNDRLNHPNKGEPSEIDREEFNISKKKYWKREYPNFPKKP